MTKEEIAELIDQMPQDMDVNDFIHELVNRALAVERERLYGKDIDTLLFEEHRLAFEKGRRSEREACAKVCEQLGMATNGMNERNHECAKAIRARGEK